MKMKHAEFRKWESDVRNACSHIVPTCMRNVICGNMLVTGVENMHLEKTDKSTSCIIKTLEHFEGNAEESSKYGWVEHYPDICLIDINREDVFKDNVIGYI